MQTKITDEDLAGLEKVLEVKVDDELSNINELSSSDELSTAK